MIFPFGWPERIKRLRFFVSLFCVFVLFCGSLAQTSPQPLKIAFTDITTQAGITFKHVASPEKKYITESMSGGVALFDYDNDGDLDIFFVNSLTVDLVKSKGKTKSALYRNDGNGKFTDVGEQAGVSDARWSTGASFVDYNHDRYLDLFVSNYVDFDVNNRPEFGQGKTCTYKSIPVQCGPRGLKGAGDSLFRNNGDGTFTDVSKED